MQGKDFALSGGQSSNSAPEALAFFAINRGFLGGEGTIWQLLCSKFSLLLSPPSPPGGAAVISTGVHRHTGKPCRPGANRRLRLVCAHKLEKG